MSPMIPRTSRTSPPVIVLFFSHFLPNSLDPPTCLICPCLVSGLFLGALVERNSYESHKRHGFAPLSLQGYSLTHILSASLKPRTSASRLRTSLTAITRAARCHFNSSSVRWLISDFS